MDKSKGREETESETQVSSAMAESLKDLPVAELMKRLSTSTDGLSQQEWQERLEKYGYNEIEEERVSPLRKFLSYFWGPIPIMIIIAAILSAVLRHWPDMGVILTLLVVNAVKMVFERLAKKAGIPRLHIHLLRHTMATNYLLSGENPIKHQRILGHETLEMTRRYVDMVAVQVAVTESRQSPVDRMRI